MGGSEHHGRSRSNASIDMPAGQLAPILRAILQHNDQIVEQNQVILQLLNYHVQNLPEGPKVPPLPKPGKDIQRISSQRTAVASHRAESPIPSDVEEVPAIPAKYIELGDARVVSSMWDAVLQEFSHQSPQFTKEYHRWSRPTTTHEAFLGQHEWTSRSYAWAFPQLIEFLQRNEAARKCHAQVTVYDFASSSTLPVASAFNEARPRMGLLRGAAVPAKTPDGLRPRIRGVNADDPYGCNLLWQSLDGCACGGGSHMDGEAERASHYRCIRGINIQDISPRVLTCLLASTPRVDLSYMAAFVQRHLASSNWGKATPLRYGEHMSSYTLEYHFSFYYVTPNVFEASSVKPDLRRQRKSARFGIDQNLRSKYIHEENLSFLLIGHFRDVSSCVQLAESYFKYDPYHTKAAEAKESSTFRPLRPDEPTASLFLSWISVALHHVLWRWQSAIDAVQAEIKTSRQIIFMDDRNDLMADDPNFSLSKTYFWALQAYKLFDDTISETIAAWEKFSDESLPNLRDARISQADWQRSLSQIDDAISELRNKTYLIKKRATEVQELRKGLISASALFDSRTSVRQGENIRLLTYITLLFLPLSFATSIFGMQFMGAEKGYLYAFVSVLPAVTVLTALFVFNMENVISLWERSADRVGAWLRRAMTKNSRPIWHDRASALSEDLAATRAPVRKAHRATTAWTYLAFILEYVFVGVPVSELATASAFIRSLSADGQKASKKGVEDGLVSDDGKSINPDGVLQKINNSLAEERKKKRWERKKQIGPALLALEDIAKASPIVLNWTTTSILDILRALLMPIWAILVVVEYLAVVPSLFFLQLFIRPSPRNTRSTASSVHSVNTSNSPPYRGWYLLGLDTVFPSKQVTVPNGEKRQSQARRHLSRVATDLTLLSGKSEKTAEPHIDLVSPLTRSTPQIRHSPQLTPSPVEDRPNTFLSHLSSANKDPSRDTMDFIEQMSRASTPAPRTPDPRSPHTSTAGLAPRAITPQPSQPPSQPPPNPPVRPSTPPRPQTAETPRSPTVETDITSRPATATTDGLPTPELSARMQSMQRGSARPVSNGEGSQQGPMQISGNMEQRARMSVQDKSAARKSELVEVEYSSRPPTPPPKETKQERPSTPGTPKRFEDMETFKGGGADRKKG